MATVRYGDFEWDDVKARTNLAKHGVSFEDASTVFADPWYILRMDDGAPDRFFALGLSGLARLLVVVHLALLIHKIEEAPAKGKSSGHIERKSRFADSTQCRSGGDAMRRLWSMWDNGSSRNRIRILAYCGLERGPRLRIVSAGKATTSEETIYERRHY